MSQIADLQDRLTHGLVPGLSQHLRCRLDARVGGIRQTCYSSFLLALPSPLAGMCSREGNAVVALDLPLAFAFLEVLLGGGATASAATRKGITDIERKLLEGVFRVLMRDLGEFQTGKLETKPELLPGPQPGEAVVAACVEIRIGEMAGKIHAAIPADSREADREHMPRLVQRAKLCFDARLSGLTVSVEDFMRLQQGDVLEFEEAAGRSLEGCLNGRLKFYGQVISSGGRRAFRVERTAY